MSLVVHPYAAAYPMLSDVELDALADDIKVIGLRHPIVTWIDSHGVEWLVDGRNRLAACDIAGVDPVFETLPADADPLAIIESENEQRRHMAISQRAMMRAKYLAAEGARVDGRWTRNSILTPTRG
jgi:ParB-like chromosome segregation protein Spo0J